MRRRTSALVAAAMVAALLPVSAATATAQEAEPAADVVISQVYGGGGNSGALYRNDFVELFNRGDAAQDLTGWAVQYGTRLSTGPWTNVTEIGGSIEPGQRYLVQMAAGNNTAAEPLPTPDATGTAAMNAGVGKIALTSSSTVVSGACPTSEDVIDAVGYGDSNCAEILVAGGTILTNPESALRDDGRCGDTFTIVSPPEPENTEAPLEPCSTAPAAVAPFISEFHYDNTGTDVGEFVEVTAPAGTDLTGYVVQPYNGNGGVTYTPVGNLSGVVADQVSGYGTATVDIAGLQNGAPDGIALIDPDGAVLEFISYEGTFTATNGPASGLESRDVGVEQTGSEPVGASIERIGHVPSTWEWISNDTNSKGEINDGLSVGGTFNAPVIPTCPNLVLDEGQSGTTGVSATDADGTVVDAEITLGDAAFQLTDEVPATEPGGTYNALVLVPNTLGAGTYELGVTFTNDDDEPQTATCEFTVTVQGDLCAVPADDVTVINEIQGDGATTPLDGQDVVTRGVVTADFTSGGDSGLPNNQGLRGFFIEAIADDRDEDDQTSEGLFVFDPAADFDGEIGDLVHVEGQAGEGPESAGLTATQVTADRVVVCNDTVDAEDLALPAPATLPLPTAPEDRAEVFEPLESMRVTHPELTVVEFFQIERFGELRLSSGGVLQNPTNVVEPGSDEYFALLASNAANNIVLDDGRTGQNLDPLPYVEPGETLRIGDQAIDETFVLHYGFSQWRLQPVDIDELTQEFQDNRTRPRPETPPAVGGSLTVAAFNVLNYFNGDGYFIGDDPEDAEGFPTARGAVTVEEFERQTEKIVDAIVRMDADILGLIEIENDAGEDQAAAALVDAINQELGDAIYDYVDTGVIGTDEIKLAFIYNVDTVEPTGDYAILDSEVDERFDDTRNRPVLAQTFTELATGESVTVANNHLKSKGSGCGAGDDDTTTGQGNCNLTRTLAAEAMADWLATNPTGEDATGTLIIGDLNSYAMEDPIDALKEEGYVDLLAAFAPEGTTPYTYTFDATQGYLDHALADQDLFPHVTGAAAWNINADEVPAIDYITAAPGRFRTAQVAELYYDPSAFRSSDHDPVLVGLQLAELPNTPPTVQDLALTTDQDTPVQGQLVIGDDDGDVLSVVYGAPTSGTVTGDNAGAFTYTPAAGFTGTATFQVTVSDGTDEATATVTITVEPVVEPGDRFVECPPGTGSGFPDVPASSVHAPFIRCGNALGLLQGKVGGLFDPAGSLTRGQVASVIDRIADATNRPIDGPRRTFSDVTGNYVHRDAIERLAGAGIITGYADGRFDPGAPVTREQLASLLVRFVESSTGRTLPAGQPFVDQASASNVHALNLLKARGAGIMTGDTAGRAHPRVDIRRDQAASLFVRTLGVVPIAD